MIISLALTIEDNVKYFVSLLLFALSLVFVSLIIDGKEKCIVSPFWSGNPRRAYNIIENKKIIDLIKKKNEDAKITKE